MVSPLHETQEITTLPKGTINSFKLLKISKVKKEHMQISNDLLSHNGRVNELFFPLRIVLHIVGRFPFSPSTSISKVKDIIQPLPDSTAAYQGKNYASSLKSLHWVYFGLTSFFMGVMFIFTTASFFEVVLEWDFLSIRQWTLNQMNIFHSNLIPFVLVWSCLFHGSVGNISFFMNRRNVVKFLNYWIFAVDRFKLDIPKALVKFLFMSNLGFVGVSILTVVSYKITSIQIVRGGSALIGIIAFRLFVNDIDKIDENFWKVRTFGLFTILYAMYASRALLFLFAFKCRLLRHCFKEWNHRLNLELNYQTKDDPEDMSHQKSNCTELFLDHAILLKLVRLTDKVFSAILLSYYGSQILNMCFELYYVALSGSLAIFNSDGVDTFMAILLLLQNIYVFLTVSLHAAYVGEEANKGFEIIKSRGLKVDDNPYRRNLLKSLQISFQQRIQLTGGHYFAIDKSFIVTVLGAVFTYFIIILQYGHQISPVLNDNYNVSSHSTV